MDKPKFRYNHKTKEWDQLYRFDMGLSVISGVRRPDGTLNSFTLRGDSPIADHYRQEQRKYNHEMSSMVERASMGIPCYE